ncbi:HU family DNA-binding protein [Desulfovirgula thermocuniculi]|uniref:HU family DNA-binding protein n=1 Tax=Desulfovirgula thermocuniculi TaxID=348842 RepID=UPI0004183AAE|nr:HU family DNA-binding protein [Desulfovirgula thermocuniculi]
MTKAELVAAVVEKAGLKKAQAERAVTAVLDAIREAVARGDEVRVVGFGTFAVRERAARKGKNPQTGEEIVIPGGRVVAFRAGKQLKAAAAAANG